MTRFLRVLAAVFVLMVQFGLPRVAMAATTEDVTLWATPLYSGGILNFSITYISNTQLDFSWLFGVDAVNIMIRGKYGSYPDDIPDEDTTPSDGYLVYYGDSTSCSDTSMNFDENPGPIYYKAWGQTAGGQWLLTPSTGVKESVTVLSIAVSLIVLGLTVLAFVLKRSTLHMVCVAVWLFFGVYMWNQTWPEGNEYLPVAFGLLSLIMVIVNLIIVLNNYLGQRTEPMTHDEIQSEHRRKVLDLTGYWNRKDRDSWFR